MVCILLNFANVMSANFYFLIQNILHFKRFIMIVLREDVFVMPHLSYVNSHVFSCLTLVVFFCGGEGGRSVV